MLLQTVLKEIPPFALATLSMQGYRLELAC